MRTIVLVLSILVVSYHLAGCATNQTKNVGPIYQLEKHIPPENKASAIIFRDKGLMNWAVDYPISVDGKLIARLGSGGVAIVNLVPGQHKAAVKFNGESVQGFEVVAGETVYLQLKPKFFGDNPMLSGAMLEKATVTDTKGLNLYLIASIDIESIQESDYVTERGGLYKGEMLRGLPNGKGTITYPKGRLAKSYVGEVRNGDMHGNGVLEFSNGAKYEGVFVNDVAEGKARFSLANGDYYEGDFKNNRKHGKGIYKLSRGTVWNSEFIKDNASGNAVIHYENGNEYQGEILNWVPEDYGLLKFADGSLAEGEFEKGKFLMGTLHDKHGKSLGVFREGLPQLAGRSTSVNHLSGLTDMARFSLEILAVLVNGHASPAPRNGNSTYGLEESSKNTNFKEVGYYHKERNSFDPATSDNEGDGTYIINGGIGSSGVQCTKTGRLINCW